MNLLVDTRAFSDYGRGNNEELDIWFKAEHQLVLPLIVIGELRSGFAAVSRRGQNEKIIQRFFDAPNVMTVGVSDKTTHELAAIYLQLRESGTPMGANDIWIAAVAKELDLTVLITDTDFQYVNGLKLIVVDKAKKLTLDCRAATSRGRRKHSSWNYAKKTHLYLTTCLIASFWHAEGEGKWYGARQRPALLPILAPHKTQVE